jgi:hypothetical protein
MKKLFYITAGILLVAGVWFYLLFIKSKKVEDLYNISICKLIKENEVKIGLSSPFSYISNYKSKLVGEILFVEIYTTTVLNVFNTNRDIELKLPLPEEVRFVQVCEHDHNVDDLFECSSNPIN